MLLELNGFLQLGLGFLEGYGALLAQAGPSAIRIVRVALEDDVLDAAIERYLRGRADSTPFHRPAWLRAVARGARQDGFMLLAVDREGAITGLLPLSLIHSPLFGRVLVSSGFAVDGGVLADRPEIAAALAEAAWDAAQRHGCSAVELRGGDVPSVDWRSDGSQYLGFAKPLEADAEAQLLAIPRKHRAELRKGLGQGLRVEIGRSERLLDTHYRLFASNVHRLGTPVFPRALFAATLEAMGEDADILLVSKDGMPVSSIFTLYHGERCMPFWHGAEPAARTLRANEVGYFSLMNAARERGLRIFDFGRSKVGTGPAAWKKSWGWPARPLIYHSRTLGGAGRDINPLSPGNRRKVELWKRLPLPVANRIGPWIARGLG